MTSWEKKKRAEAKKKRMKEKKARFEEAWKNPPKEEQLVKEGA
jgi:hypothetical protein